MANRPRGLFSQLHQIRSSVPGLTLRQCQLSISPPHRGIATRMEPSKVRYEFMEEVERIDFYVPGGYHPIQLGDELNAGRYVIAHKLGFGRSATTWLAEDRIQKRLVALKVSTAESAERTHELSTLSRLAQAEYEFPGKRIVQKLLDSFTFSGPNGTHRCLVTDVARVNLHEAKDAAYHQLVRLPAARSIAAQVILDLHLANILLRLPLDMQDMTFEQLRTRAGEPEKQQVIRQDGAPLDPGVPSELIIPAWLGLGGDEITLADSKIRIADFGELFYPCETDRFTAHTPLLLAPPDFASLSPEDRISLFLAPETFEHWRARSGISLGIICRLRRSLSRWMR
ncbi:hypothetical protein BO70DRAFT_362052 [Aspergillus heteromorphus CBS 117.55]|uniref:non-specific serine/threonine protein kinase n=1 Tax=Aspergillus heteromorphus CBS 117.55 TaxID=1448321 RepID=A0A317WD84_9EURO|nr:uncharacterized protein BO70DRAFT_362052 [Aspergillus heteromorphus CBS 117.55]PWY82130.1 hypothetical protein BO70DRAFT_362052 [Aspergillus heteromorphus CBS 117.55]